MAWQDRHYYRDQNSFSGNPLMWLLSGSVPLFTIFGIRVRMHASMFLLIAVALVMSSFDGPVGVVRAFTGSAVLFAIVLLHEFGHCFAARWVGGDARDILMWPLGGLAYADAPNRPGPQLITAAGGPMVNVIICLLAAAVQWVISWGHPQIQWNPVTRELHIPAAMTVSFYVWWVYAISLGLLIFNLMPIFPLDGGRILQTALWFKLGYYRATLIACVVGMVGSALLVIYALATFGSWYSILLILIALSCFMTCFQLRAQLRAAGPWEFQDEGVDYSASLWHGDERGRRRKKLSRRSVRKLRRQAQEEEAEQQRIDAILAKVSAHGMHSLTWTERRTLRKATERQRQREIELSRGRA